MGNSSTSTSTSNDKHEKMFYHGFPTYGYYVNCLNRIYHIAKDILIRAAGTHNVVTFDFDNTLVYTRLPPQILYPKIPQMVDLIQLAYLNKYTIFIITSRKNHENILLHCNIYNIHPNYIVTIPQELKPTILKRLSNKISIDHLLKLYPNNLIEIQPPLSRRGNLILSFGDQWTDILYAPDDEQSTLPNGFKLPDPTDMNAYSITDGNINLH
jgi:hypothetical protein